MVAANGIYKLAVIGTAMTQQHIHTLHFKSTNEPESLTMSEDEWQQDLIDEWQANCRTQYRAIFPTYDLPVQTYQVRKVCGSVPLPAGIDEGEVAGSIAGTRSAAGDGLAPWLCGVTTLRTGFAGRRYRGRNFIGGLMEGDVAGPLLAASYLTPVTAYYAALTSTFVVSTDITTKARLFVFSRKQMEEFPATPCQSSGALVTSVQVRDQLASMKSRKAGSGL